MRTNNSTVWVFPIPEVKASFGEHGRFLKVSEKIRIMGFSDVLFDCLSKNKTEVALGNTIAPPQAAFVLLPILRAFRIMKRSRAVGF